MIQVVRVKLGDWTHRGPAPFICLAVDQNLGLLVLVQGANKNCLDIALVMLHQLYLSSTTNRLELSRCGF
jgi:hypothetical protein